MYMLFIEFRIDFFLKRAFLYGMNYFQKLKEYQLALCAIVLN